MSYEIRVYCSNCGKFSTVKIDKGTPKDDVVDQIECPHCEVEGYCTYS